MHPNGPPSTAIFDTAATGMFGDVDPDSTLVGNKSPDQQPITVAVANGEFITFTHTAKLLLPELPPSARLIRLFPHMTEILLSIGLLCDHGCTAHFYKHYCLIRYHGKIILTGTRNKSTNYLWTLDRPANTPDFLTALDPHTNQPEHKMCSATRDPSATPAERVIYGHATLFSPALGTLETALDKKLFPNIPGLTKASVKAHPPVTVATVKGHQNQNRKNKNSTKNITPLLYCKSPQPQTLTTCPMHSHRPSPLVMPPIVATPQCGTPKQGKCTPTSLASFQSLPAKETTTSSYSTTMTATPSMSAPSQTARPTTLSLPLKTSTTCWCTEAANTIYTF